MDERAPLDLRGAMLLVVIMLVLAGNQVVIKLTNGGFAPVFGAGLRSAGSMLVIAGWMWLRGVPFVFARATMLAGLAAGMMFAGEFICLYLALDLTSVSRVSVIFYSMPLWMALAAHFLLPGERLTPLRAIGLTLAFGGVAWAIFARGGDAGQASLAGDLLALAAALGWMGVSLAARVTPLARLGPEMQILWQLVVSAPILIAVAPLFGPLMRAPGPWHWAGLGYQVVLVAAWAFLAWFWLLKRYQAGAVASFGFLPPVIGVGLGWALLGEQVGWPLIGALVLVVAGLGLINRR